MSNIISNFRYHPEIDGLRAIALAAVLLFHAGLSFSGGYIGVDVFFVISGYLITSILVRDIERDNFSFIGFWERRVRRIFPPLAVMVVLVIILGTLLLLLADFESLGESAAMQAVSLANFYFWQESGCFGSESGQMPLLHTWSLAVEEQFYCS